MTSAPPARTGPRDDVRMARLHLRMGQLILARAELEDMLRQGALTIGGLAALAEARWRMGDGNAATEAARAHLDAGGSDDVALCIAAEAVAADGRPSDARALMDRLPASDAATLDALFAGMPRRAFWPAGPVDRSDLDELRRESDSRASGPRRSAAGAGTGQRPPAEAQPSRGNMAPDRAVPGPRDVMEAAARLGWELESPPPTDDSQRVATRPAAGAIRDGDRVRRQFDPAAELDRALEEMATKPERALLRLSLVLRYDPTLAPAVLQIVHLRREPAAALVRGDAQRLLGRHLEAEAAFDAAAESLEVS